MKLLKFELKRMIRSRVLQLSITLLMLIGVLGVILYNIYYADIDDSRFLHSLSIWFWRSYLYRCFVKIFKTVFMHGTSS